MSPDEVHLWYIPLNQICGGPPALAALSADEQSRASRYRFSRDRDRFTQTRTALRSILGEYLNTDPSHLRFDYHPNGKPTLKTISFNVSHSGSLAAIAITPTAPIGIDIEELREVPEWRSIAESHFSASERADLLGAPPALKQQLFFRIWTRKEAYVKAMGTGLSAPLDRFDVSVLPAARPAILRIEGDAQQASQWTLHHLDPSPTHVGALACKLPACRVETYYFATTATQPKREK